MSSDKGDHDTSGWRSKPAVMLVLLVTFALAGAKRVPQSDPLPSWNDSVVKQSIISFVNKATAKDSSDFIPESARIAVFDNDGTLWSEKPEPTEVFFIRYLVQEQAQKDPSIKQTQPFKALLEGDVAYLQQESDKVALKLMTETYSGLSQEQFTAEAHHFLETARHPKYGEPYTSLAYSPMLELLAYLRANGFQLWICSGGTADFMRVFAPQIYGVPSWRIMGTILKRQAELQDCKRVIKSLPQLETFNDKDQKPVNIDRQIGERPVFVAGNVGGFGDIAMMQYSKGRNGISFQLLVNHDDAKREFSYSEPNNGSLDAAKKCGFTVLSMKDDWKTIFAFQKAASATQ